MSAKDESSHVSIPDQRFSHSLRLRVVLWYGTLVTIALVTFAALVWGVTTDVLGQSVTSAVRAEARAASLQVNNELLSTPPYWPTQVALPGLDAYKEPGVVVEVVDAQGNLRYDSDKNPAMNIPVHADDKRAALTGQSLEYQATIDGQRVQVEIVPVHAPTPSVTRSATAGSDSTKTSALAANASPVIGMLLVAKSLSDVNATLSLVRTLLFSVGGVTLPVALLSGWAIAARVLSPLAEIAKMARAIAVSTEHGTRIGNLSQRVSKPGGRDEMVQVVDAFNEMLTNLEHATQAQRRFVADASHELRAPLTTIQGNLAFLQRHAEELPVEERRTMLSDAHAETLRLAQLVDELLLLARADASADTLPTLAETETAHSKQSIELDHTVLQLVRQLRGRLSDEGARVQLNVGSIEPVRVRGNEESIRRILLILLDNAFKYTAMYEKSEVGSVTISLQRKENEAVLRVHDTGIGIEPADLPHIFERFYRADRARSRQGTGLGLSIAQTLVEQLDGHITAESTPGQGSTFSVWLPLSLKE
ncbi:MAG: HAMP domain-containing histidine kinase [Chloroflexota bacterium]|nr:HAMP domain-containing histidine kinase [Chloroflexota bacterium]